MRALFAGLAICLAGMAGAQQAADTVAPEGVGTGRVVTSRAVAEALEAKAAGRPVEAR